MFDIDDYVEKVLKNDYDFYDKYVNFPEIILMGSSNVGKSSLINALAGKKVAKAS